jgi:hypothetical protein
MASLDPFRMTKLVVSFNRHFFLLAVGASAGGFVALRFISSAPLRWLISFGIAAAVYFMVASVVASYFIYDHSDLYKLRIWPARSFSAAPRNAVLVHAGYDPAADLVRRQFPEMCLHVLDFFGDTSEPSIRRAHEMMPIPANEEHISAANWPIPAVSQDAVFALSAAHEIRQDELRGQFFHEAARVLRQHGRMVVIEQLRNFPNFLCFGPAAWHFLSRRTWLRSFAAGGLVLCDEFPLSPWMRVFVLERV